MVALEPRNRTSDQEGCMSIRHNVTAISMQRVSWMVTILRHMRYKCATLILRRIITIGRSGTIFYTPTVHAGTCMAVLRVPLVYLLVLS